MMKIHLLNIGDQPLPTERMNIDKKGAVSSFRRNELIHLLMVSIDTFHKSIILFKYW